MSWPSLWGGGKAGGAGAGGGAGGICSASTLAVSWDATSISERKNASFKLISCEFPSSILPSRAADPPSPSSVRCLLFGVSWRSFHSGSTVRFLSSWRSLSSGAARSESGGGRSSAKLFAGESVISKSSVRSMMSSSPETSRWPSSGIEESKAD